MSLNREAYRDSLQAPGALFVTQTLARGEAHVDFPFVTNFVRVSNDGISTIRFADSQTNLVTGFVLSGSVSVDLPIQIATLWLTGSGGLNESGSQVSVCASLSDVPTSKF